MHVGRVVEIRVAHRQTNRFRGLVDLRRPTDVFGQKVARVGDADAEPLAACRASASRWGARVNTVRCRLTTPSVPPDITKAIRSSTSRGAGQDAARASPATPRRRSRVKSLTPPLPSVLPSTATISDGATSPLRSVRSVPKRRRAPWSGYERHSHGLAVWSFSHSARPEDESPLSELNGAAAGATAPAHFGHKRPK